MASSWIDLLEQKLSKIFQVWPEKADLAVGKVIAVHLKNTIYAQAVSWR